MSIKKYRKKPVVIEALLWDGNNTDEALGWLGDSQLGLDDGEDGYFAILINTLEGITQASIGDFIIKGTMGEFYPCKPDIFAMAYAFEEESA